MNENGASTGGDLIDLREVVAVWLRRRWLVAGLMGVVAALFVVGWVVEEPRYRAQGTLRVEPERSSVPGVTADMPLRAGLANPIQSEIEVIRSRSLLDAVAESLGLQLVLPADAPSRAALFPDLVIGEVEPGAYVLAADEGHVRVETRDGRVVGTERPGEMLSAAGLRFVAPPPARVPVPQPFVLRPLRAASQALAADLQVSAVRETNLIEVAYAGRDPALAAEIVNATMDLAIRQSIQRRRQQASARRRFIEEQIADFEGQLADAQADVQAFRESIGVLSVESEEAGQIANILAFERQLEELRLERELYASVLPTARGAEADTARVLTEETLERIAGTPALANNPAIADLYRRLVALESKRDSMRAALAGPRSGTLSGIDAQVAAAQASLVDALREYVDGLERRMAAVRRTVQRLRNEAEALLPRAAELDRRLQRLQSLRGIVDALQTRLEQTRIEEAAEGGDLVVIDRAVVPLAPANRTRPFDVIVAAIVAVIVGLGGPLAVERFDDRVRTPEDIRRHSSLTLLGGIPELRVRNGRGRTAPLVFTENMASGPAEAYRMLRTNLGFQLRLGGHRTILVTSPGPGEGKTTTAVNLAMSLAQQGNETVLVDADLRRAAVHGVLEVPQRPGLAEVLVGDLPVDEAVRPSGYAHLSVLAAGTLPPNPAELIGGGRAAETFARLRERFDYAVIDSPPLLSVADAALLARGADATVLVVRIGGTHGEAVVHGLEQLRMAEARVLGIVANALKSGPGYRSRYYRYAYREPA